MAWKVVVDFDLCESNAICMGIVPEVFEVRDDNFLYVLQENPPDELREKCRPGRPAVPEAGHQHRRELNCRARRVGAPSALGYRAHA